MRKIKLVNGTVIEITEKSLVNGILKISTKEKTVEELAELFSNKENTSYIATLSRNDVEIGFNKGFTSFAGITYDTERVKTVELFQPKDVTEARIANLEGVTNETKNTVASVETSMSNFKVEQKQEMENALTDMELAITEMYEMVLGGNE
jgi:hypothetical protein